jgi:protein gp37
VYEGQHGKTEWMLAKYGRSQPLDWVIIGGESGAGARPMQIAWVQGLIEQCRLAGVACFVKQLGARPVWEEAVAPRLRDRKGGDWSEWPKSLRVREFPFVAAE